MNFFTTFGRQAIISNDFYNFYFVTVVTNSYETHRLIFEHANFAVQNH